MTIDLPTRPMARAPRRLPARLPVALLCTASLLAGCSSLGEFMSGDRIDYRSATPRRSAGLEVPPDLTQLSRDGRYQPVAAGGSVSAVAMAASAAASAPAAPATTTGAAASEGGIAVTAMGGMRIDRDGQNNHWLVVPLSAEQLWPQLQQFWFEQGFTIETQDPVAGTLQTDWAENRAKLPQDGVRRLVGSLLDTFYSTGELDRFRTRVERRADGGSDVYLTHRGMEEIYTNRQQERTGWQARPQDRQLEAQMLSRLMVKLGASQEQARDATATASAAAAAATAASGAASGPAAAPLTADTLQVADGFDRAWRRVGLALDRSGFSVEDRDRANGVYFVRYAGAGATEQNKEPGFFARLFSSKDDATPPGRYRIAVRSQAEASTVSVQDAQGQPVPSDVARRILEVLRTDLR